MPSTKNEDDRRVTVIFSLKDFALIKRRVRRETKAQGYTVYVSDVLRGLVREHLGNVKS